MSYLCIMRLLRSVFLLASLSWACLPAYADQTDARLEALFGDLLAAPAAGQAAPVENKIWTIWHETPDKAAAELLASGIERMATGDFTGALKAFDQVVVQAPDFAEGWNKRATVHYLMNNFQQSLDDIAKTLELEPRHFGALSGRGLVYIKLDDLHNALTAFEQVLKVHPQMHGPRANADAIRKVLKQRDI